MQRVILTILFICVVKTGWGQDPHFSQFFSSPLYLSPSLSGAGSGSRIILNYRNQWPSIQNAYLNYAFSVDHYFKDYNSGVGLLALRNEEGGAYGFNTIAGTYAYNIQINNKWNVNPGLLLSYNNNFIDWNKLQFGDQIYRNANTTIESAPREFFNYIDANSSLILYSEQLWFGFTASHLLNFNKRIALEEGYPALKISVYGGARLSQRANTIMQSDKSYTIAFMYKNQDRYHQLDLGAYYERDYLRIGLWLRGSNNYLDKIGLDATVILAGFTYEQYKFNYSYDISTSRLMSLSGGAHEISMLYTISGNNFRMSRKRRMVPCPEF